MKSLGSIFGSTVGNTGIPPHIAGGIVTRVNIVNEVRLITLWVHFNRLIGHDDLIYTEKLYSKSVDSVVVICFHGLPPCPRLRVALEHTEHTG